MPHQYQAIKDAGLFESIFAWPKTVRSVQVMAAAASCVRALSCIIRNSLVPVLCKARTKKKGATNLEIFRVLARKKALHPKPMYLE